MDEKPTYEELERRIQQFQKSESELKMTEKNLREREERYRSLIDSSPLPFLITQEEKIVFVNPALLGLFGVKTENEIIGTSPKAWIHPDFMESAFQRRCQALEKNEALEPVELTLVRKDGHEIAVLANTVCIRHTGMPAILSMFQDITERKQAEKALLESEELFRGMFKDHSAVMLLIDPHTGQIVEANQAAAQYYGYPLENMIKMKIQQLNLLSPAEVMQKMGGAFNKQVNIFEFRHVLADGQIRDVEVHSTPIAIQNQTLLFSIIHDITERKRAEKALRESAVRLRQAHQMAKLGHWDWEMFNGELSWSDEVYAIFGRDKYNFQPSKESFEGCIHPDDYQDFLNERETAIAKNRPVDIEHRIKLPDGTIRYVQELAEILKDNDGNIVRVSGTVQDITERKQAEKALAQKSKLLEEAQVLANLGSWEWDIVHDTWYFSEQWQKIHGVSDNDLDTSKLIEIAHPEDAAHIKKAFTDAKEHGKIYDIEHRIIRADNKEIRYIKAFGDVEYDQDTGSPVRMVGAAQDITERKQAETEQEKLQEQLSQAQKMESVGRLAGGVAHDFNNMLGVILGHTELALLQADENHELHDDLKEIQKAAKRSADITKQLLAFARKQTISPRQLDLNDTVESMLNMLRRLIGEDIDLVWKPSAHLWSVKMDPSQVDQILANLCINAKDAISGVGKLTIETGKKSFDEEYCKEHPGFIPGDFVLLAVSDNGCGMDKKTLDNLFEPFFTTKEVGKGTGLGLATIYGIVKQNNGFINVYSEPGQGSTFRIYLPRLVADEDIDKAVPEKKEAAGGTETILLVEDEPTILRMTRMMLEKKGYTVLPAATPGEAVEKAKNHSSPIDLLMTDVVMPEMNGRELSGLITDLYPDIKLLFMSGYTSDIIAHQGVLDAGVAFIQKPFSMADLTEKMRNILDSAPNWSGPSSFALR